MPTTRHGYVRSSTINTVRGLNSLRGRSGIYRGLSKLQAKVRAYKALPRPALRGSIPKGPRRGGKALVNKIKTSIGVLSSSVFKAKLRPSPQVLAMERIGAPQMKVSQNNFVIKGDFGFQSASSVPLLDRVFLKGCVVGIPDQPWPSGYALGPRRFVFESLLSELTLSNMTTGGVEMEIWDIVSKRDLLNVALITTGQSATGANTYSVGFDPVQYWNYGVCAAEGNAPSTVPAPYTIMGSTPFDSQFFKDHFRVKKRTIVMLPQGGCHRHVVNLAPNKLIDETLYNDGNLSGFGGLTMFTLVRARGLPVANLPDTGPGFTTTSGETQVNCIQVLRAKYTYVQAQASQVFYTDNLTSPASANIVNIGSGAVEAMARTA